MISYIKNLLSSFGINKSRNIENFSGNNRLEFIIGDTEPNIKVSIIDTDDQSARMFADLIHSLVSGYYTNSIHNLLIDLSKQDKDIKEFVTKTLFYYNLLLINKPQPRSDNDPVIKPTEFLKYGK